jgi:hypothetical protein
LELEQLMTFVKNHLNLQQDLYLNLYFENFDIGIALVVVGVVETCLD